MAETKRATTLLIENYIKSVEDNVLKNKKFTALLQKKGRIVFKQSGYQMNWKVRKFRNSLTPYTDADSLIPARVNRHEQATLAWRVYQMAERYTLKERKMARGKEAIVKYVMDLTEWMMDDAKYHFSPELFKDGNADGNTDRIHGMESWLGYTGNAQYTLPDDSYAGHVTDLGNEGSVVTGTWPIGTFTPDYSWWSPLIVNYTHANWGASTDNWANNGPEVLSAGFIHHQNQYGKNGQLDVVIMDPQMYEQFLQNIRVKERIDTSRGGSNSLLVSLGFGNVVNWDGVDVTSDADATTVGTGRAYGINFDGLTLRCLTDQLFETKEDYDLLNLSDNFALVMLGNLQGNPQSTVYWRNIT